MLCTVIRTVWTKRCKAKCVQLKIYQEEESADLLGWASPLRFTVYFQLPQSKVWSSVLQIEKLDLNSSPGVHHLWDTDSHQANCDKRIIYQRDASL